jgi:hypothetical protein
VAGARRPPPGRRSAGLSKACTQAQVDASTSSSDTEPDHPFNFDNVFRQRCKRHFFFRVVTRQNY